MRRSLARMAGALALWAVLPVSGQPGSIDPEKEPTLAASDDRASVQAWIDLPEGRLELLGRFEGVVEVRADAGVRIDNWSIDDAMGDSMLVTVLDANPLGRREIGDWYGRYEVIVEPLVDGRVTVGPLTLTYLIDPDPEADPTQLEPERVKLASGSLEIEVASPGGANPRSTGEGEGPDRGRPGVRVAVGADCGRVGRCGRARGDGVAAGGSFDDAPASRGRAAGLPGRARGAGAGGARLGRRDVAHRRRTGRR